MSEVVYVHSTKPFFALIALFAQVHVFAAHGGFFLSTRALHWGETGGTARVMNGEI